MILKKDVTTFCQGPRLSITQDISKKDFLDICQQMQTVPEMLYQGGFRFHKTRGFKTMRFYLENSERNHEKINIRISSTYSL